MKRWLNFSICFSHLLFLLLLLFAPRMHFTIKQKKALTVREYKTAPLVKQTKRAPPKIVQPQAKPSALPAPLPQKPAPRTVAKKMNTPPPAAQKPKKAPVNSALSSLAKELEKSIAQMEPTSHEKRSAPLSKIAKLQIDAPEKEESDYEASLTRYLHTALHLPDFGAVKMQLTVSQDGTITKLLVLKAESEENRKYLEKHIPLLHFPPLQGEYAKDKTHTFVLTFCNEL